MAYKFSKGTRGLGDITFEDDADTGIDFDQNKISLETGGAERLVVTDTGVGIGTDNPGTLLHISGSSPAITLQRDNNSNDSSMINFEGQAGSIACQIGQVAGTDNELAFSTHDGSLTERMRIDKDGNVGIGTTSPVTLLHIDGTTDSSLSNHGLLVLGPTNSTNMTLDQNEIIARNNGGESTLYLQASGGGVKLGNTASGKGMEVASDGLVHFYKGIRSSPGVKVNSATTDSANQWIKIAHTTTDPNDYDISSSTFLVTFVGVMYNDSQPYRQRYIVSTRVLADDDSDPYYEDKGTDVLVSPLDAEFLDGFNPGTDILLAIERDTTPQSQLWIKATQQHVDVYVTHLNGSTVDTTASDIGWNIASGESWNANPPSAVSYYLVYGGWASHKMKNFETTGAEKRGYTDVSFSGFSVKTILSLPGPTDAPQETPERILLCVDGGTHDGSGHRVVGLPNVSESDKRVITIKDSDGSAASSNIRITGQSSQTIDGAFHYYITANYGSITVLCNGTEWKIIGKV